MSKVRLSSYEARFGGLSPQLYVIRLPTAATRSLKSPAKTAVGAALEAAHSYIYTSRTANVSSVIVMGIYARL